MQNALWSAIYDIFTEVDSVLTQVERFGSIQGSSSGRSGPSAGPIPQRKPKGADVKLEGLRAAYSETAGLVEVRIHIRAKLDLLKAALSAKLTEREVYLVLFPIVVRFDEMVQNRFLTGSQAVWPPLQKELFGIDNGGEALYDTLDDLLRKPETLPFVYEVYYFVLSDGFKGKYADNFSKINEYKTKLSDKIPLPPVPKQAAHAEAPNLVVAERFPVKYYAAAAVLLAGAYFILWHLAGR